ncbi:signal transduction histidine kinase [Nocardiopsis sp. Huas11]|uniref:sensor histidine kinase n=1 Tax=Nocardiopsis sp. Huas11 TaxID=2183912 RepID=UPI000EAEB599|nr:ATP-binding protein [Nocardiopsis sp. Huas11]RKS10534.1 signal transduction histidine kinase [Nocardiopsis sp. Huas11]
MGAAREATRPDRGRGPTLRTRLTLVYTGVFALGGVLLLGANYLVAATSLRDRGLRLATTIDAVAREGEEVYPTEPAQPAERLETWSQTQELSGSAEPAALLVGGYQDGVLSDMLVNSVLALVAITLLAAAAGWLIAGRPMRRLHWVTETARTLSEHDLHSRLGLTGPDDEFRELGDTFDAMLSRLERAFDSQRRFVANASHELRTPLAVQRAALEVPLAQDRVPDDLRPAFRRALDSVGRSESLISGLLLLARSDRGLAATEEVDLAAIVREAVDRHGDEARREDVELRVDAAPARVRGDAVLLEHLVRNLVENAVRYNRPGGWVEVRLRAAHGRTVVKVTNTGAEVADPDALFEPFHRGDEARLHGARSGSGLGLSIVRSIALAHGAAAAARARPGGGLVVTVGFAGP